MEGVVLVHIAYNFNTGKWLFWLTSILLPTRRRSLLQLRISYAEHKPNTSQHSGSCDPRQSYALIDVFCCNIPKR
jgi:hypothetical protein